MLQCSGLWPIAATTAIRRWPNPSWGKASWLFLPHTAITAWHSLTEERAATLHHLFLVGLLGVTGLSILVSKLIKGMCADGRRELSGALPQCIHHDYVKLGNAPPRFASLSDNNNAMMPQVIVEAGVYRKAPLRFSMYCCYITFSHFVSNFMTMWTMWCLCILIINITDYTVSWIFREQFSRTILVICCASSLIVGLPL